MKIALLHYSSPPIVGGVESVLAQHARLMTKAGHEVTILSGRGEVFDERIRVRVLPRLDSRHADVMEVKEYLDAGKHTPAFEMLRELIRQELRTELMGCDVLIAHNVASLNKNLALTAVLHDEYNKPGFPHLILWHHDLAWTTPRYRGELHAGHPWDLLRTKWEGVTQVVVSELRRGELAELYGILGQEIKVIPNGVDLTAFFKFEAQTVELIDRLNLLQADPLFLLPVRLTPRKNIELALNVIAQLRNHNPGAMLLITGAVWANESWGRYWGWDSKETGALVAWLAYAGFLHTRIAHSWTGRRSAYFAIVGFLLVIFTYLGVSYLLPGLHSYA